MNNMTIVTGLWNIGYEERSFEDHYIPCFKRFLDIPQNLFIYIEKKYEYIVWEKRDRSNTFVKTYELEDVKKMYAPFWDRTQKIRTSEEWLGQAHWIKDSPQGKYEWYNPIVMSKMFFLNDVTIWNPFNTEYFYWLDAGITNTVRHDLLADESTFENITKYSNPFLFLSFSYPFSVNEVHGFNYKKMNEYCGKYNKYVCRGGLFGGHKDQINELNGSYYSLLDRTLNENLMGTEESLFTILQHREPHIYKRYELGVTGHVVKFVENLQSNNIQLENDVPNVKTKKRYTDKDVEKLKTNLYVLTFNFPEQLLHTIECMKKSSEWLTRPNLFLLDNSTNEEAREEYRKIAKENNFEYISMGENRGICGGRQFAADHFNDSDADFMFFFEDDMTINSSEEINKHCRNGFRKYIPNLYNIVHKIMLREKFDFLKLSFTEVFFDNDKQCSWYNVPQHIRTRDWPDYDQLPINGLDPNVPLTNFKNIRSLDEVSYIDGEVYYANWPMIVSKEGNRKMFIETKWAHPYEQTWMSYIYQKTKEGELKPAVLLASPIYHNRIKHYKPEERREN